jgi:hypothetical protein
MMMVHWRDKEPTTNNQRDQRWAVGGGEGGTIGSIWTVHGRNCDCVAHQCVGSLPTGHGDSTIRQESRTRVTARYQS